MVRLAWLGWEMTGPYAVGMSDGCLRPRMAPACLSNTKRHGLTPHTTAAAPHSSRHAVVEVVRCIGGASVSHVVDVFRGELSPHLPGCLWLLVPGANSSGADGEKGMSVVNISVRSPHSFAPHLSSLSSLSFPPGNNTVGIRKAGHASVPVYGCGKALCRNNGEAERLVRRMVVRSRGDPALVHAGPFWSRWFSAVACPCDWHQECSRREPTSTEYKQPSVPPSPRRATGAGRAVGGDAPPRDALGCHLHPGGADGMGVCWV